MNRHLLLCATVCAFSACSSSESNAPPPKTAAELGEPSDDVDPEMIGAAVRDNANHFQICYEAGRERNPELTGRVEIRFLINSDGSVAQAAIVDTDLPSHVTKCVINAFYGLRLPRQDSAVVAQYPMYFQPG